MKEVKIYRNYLKTNTFQFYIISLISIYNQLSYRELKSKSRFSDNRLKKEIKQLLEWGILELDQNQGKLFLMTPVYDGDFFYIKRSLVKKFDKDLLKVYTVIKSGTGKIRETSGVSQSCLDKCLRRLLYKKLITIDFYALYISKNERNLLNMAQIKPMGIASKIVKKYKDDLLKLRILRRVDEIPNQDSQKHKRPKN